MNIRKILIYIAVAIVGVMLWQAWVKDNPEQKSVPTTTAQQQAPASPESFTPDAYTPNKEADKQAKTTPEAVQPSSGKIISVTTDVFQIGINLAGGNIVDAKLPGYPVSLEQKNQPIQILKSNKDNLYISQSGLTNIPDKTPLQFTASQSDYQLQAGQDQLTVTLTAKTKNGLTVTKEYIFKRKNYSVQANITVKNDSNTAWQGSVFNQIIRKNVPVVTSYHSSSYDGAAYYTPNTPYTKLPYKKMLESDLNLSVTGGWVAMQQQYFISAWVPAQNQNYRYYSRMTEKNGTDVTNKMFIVGYVMPQMNLAPQQSASETSTLYVGPEIATNLKKLAPGLEATIDYGWLYPISKIIFSLMAAIHSVVGNWGWSIILVTLLIKIVFYWFSDKSYKSMAKMRNLQPKIDSLKERLGDDKQAMSKAMMELYRKEKVNPMGGCLPMLIQVPVFIALYYVLIESVQLRQAPWILWVHDLSVRDPYFILPILMGASMLLQTYISPKPADPMQAKIMYLMPVIFTVIFWSFPAGLVLYWLTNQLLSIAQQWYVFKTYKPEKVSHKKKK